MIKRLFIKDFAIINELELMKKGDMSVSNRLQELIEII